MVRNGILLYPLLLLPWLMTLYPYDKMLVELKYVMVVGLVLHGPILYLAFGIGTPIMRPALCRSAAVTLIFCYFTKFDASFN